MCNRLPTYCNRLPETLNVGNSNFKLRVTTVQEK